MGHVETDESATPLCAGAYVFEKRYESLGRTIHDFARKTFSKVTAATREHDDSSVERTNL